MRKPASSVLAVAHAALHMRRLDMAPARADSKRQLCRKRRLTLCRALTKIVYSHLDWMNSLPAESTTFHEPNLRLITLVHFARDSVFNNNNNKNPHVSCFIRLVPPSLRYSISFFHIYCREKFEKLNVRKTGSSGVLLPVWWLTERNPKVTVIFEWPHTPKIAHYIL